MIRSGAIRGLLVIAPHPDDEAIGAYGLMARLRRRGVTVRVVIVSDGAASHPSSATWPRERLIRERRRETRRAMRRIGLTPRDITYLGLPDGGLSEVSDTVRQRIAACTRRIPKPSLIVGPMQDDAHPDHRVVAAGLAACRISGGRRLGYAVWPAVRRQALGSAMLRLTSAEQRAKRQAILSYRTQTGLITDDPSGFAMTSAHILAFSRPSETFREVRG